MQHTCAEPALQEPDVIGAREEMRQMASERATRDLGKSVRRVWNGICAEVANKYGGDGKTILKASREEICNLIAGKRRSENSSDVWKQLTSGHYSQISPIDKRLFIKFSFQYELIDAPSSKTGKLLRMPMWAHPDLLRILRRRGVSVYIDATFKCVPSSFKQCAIMMVFDDETDLYLPVVFALMEDKSQWSYWHFLHLILVATETKLQPSTITCDFERGLINACREQFPDADIIGCLFHFKQALRRKMIKLRLPGDEISRSMQAGMLDSLTATAHGDIESKISYLRSELDETDAVEWDDFWTYFRTTWMDREVFDLWNLSTIKEKGKFVQNRTNNALENFNKQLKAGVKIDPKIRPRP